jgi:hypothetical protein
MLFLRILVVLKLHGFIGLKSKFSSGSRFNKLREESGGDIGQSVETNFYLTLNWHLL